MWTSESVDKCNHPVSNTSCDLAPLALRYSPTFPTQKELASAPSYNERSEDALSPNAAEPSKIDLVPAVGSNSPHAASKVSQGRDVAS